MHLKKLFIVLDKKEVKNIPLNAENIFCRTGYIKQCINEKYFNVISPNPKKTSLQSKDLLRIENKLTEYIVDKSNKYNSFHEIYSIEELLKPYLEIRISSYLYMKTVIPKSEKYFIYKGRRWICFDNKEDVIIEIENNLSKENNSLYYYWEKTSCTSFKFNWFVFS